MRDSYKISLRARQPTYPSEFWIELFAAYQTLGRHYHTIAHVAEVAGHYDRVAADVGWRQPDEVLLAILFHDAVYRVGANDNEQASARLAEASARRWLSHTDIDHQRAVALIELSAYHGRLERASLDEDAALFLDCDMAILGAEPEAYQCYASAVAKEFLPLISIDAYRAGRHAFLKRLLDAPRIFLSDYFHKRLDSAARENLRREAQIHCGLE